jgi:hypothetical protein
MENNYQQQVSDGNHRMGFGFRLQNVMSFIRSFINEFKVTEQDLIDAGVMSTRKERSKDWIESKQTASQYQKENG